MSDKELPKDKKSDGVEPEESLEQSSTETNNDKTDPVPESAAGEPTPAETSAEQAVETAKEEAPDASEEVPEGEVTEEKVVDAPAATEVSEPVTEKSPEPAKPLVEATTKTSEENSEETKKEEVAEAEVVEEKYVDAPSAKETSEPVAEKSPEPAEPVLEAVAKTSEEDSEETKTDEKQEGESGADEEVESSDAEHEEEAKEEEIDYHSLNEEQLIAAFESLLKNKPVQQIKNDLEEIKTEFNSKFEEELEHQKKEFLDGGGNIIDFHYTTPLKKRFNSLYFDYREKRNQYYQNLKRDLQANYKLREELIEELKGLLNAEENINTTYKHFKDIQERWHTAGAIPRDKYNTIWNTYRHHVENFYDFLHLNREFRDLDFKHNLDQKLKLIGRAEELAQQSDVGKAFRELQMLHKMWKEDVGPVAKQYRDEVWDKFSAATKVIHDKRQDYIKEQEKHYEVNYESKLALINGINEVTESTAATHKAWQNAIKEVQKLRDQYFETGKVPRTKAKEIWNTFKEATRNFNKSKNSFYKNQKKEQYTNLEKKRALIQIAEENKDSEDFEVVTPLMKKVQQDWKNIGHVPRKESDKIWKQFKAACNHYFDKVHAERNEAIKEEMEHFEAKKGLLDSLATLELTEKPEDDLKTVKSKIKEWKEIGRVPFNKKNIERKFNKKLDELFGKLKLDKQQAEMIRFENKLSSMASEEDNRKLQNEEFFITKRISETQGEIRQLENNLGFFRHAKDDNPLVKEVHNNIARHKEQLSVWKSKLKKIRSLRK